MALCTYIRFFEISIAAAAIWTGGAAWGQASSRPASLPGAITTPAAPSDDALPKAYNNVPMDRILDDFARRFNIVVVKPGPLNGRVTLRIPDTLDADSAVDLMENILRPYGLAIEEQGDDIRVWNVIPQTAAQLAVAAARAQEKTRLEALPPATARTMEFKFVDIPIETVLDEISSRLGVEIDRAEPIPGRVTISVPQAVDADAALGLLNSILISHQYTAIPIDRTYSDGTPRPAVRIGTIDDAKKGNIPVD